MKEFLVAAAVPLNDILTILHIKHHNLLVMFADVYLASLVLSCHGTDHDVLQQ